VQPSRAPDPPSPPPLFRLWVWGQLRTRKPHLTVYLPETIAVVCRKWPVPSFKMGGSLLLPHTLIPHPTKCR